MPPPRLAFHLANPHQSFPLLASLPRCTNLLHHHLPPIPRYPHPSLSSTQQTRAAHHASQGQANRPSRGAGKRLGLKRAASELVVPGNIIFRQRGSKWWPGPNCGMGRDHTIYAKEKGYVTFYKEEGKFGKRTERKFIGVVFKRGDKLPVPPGRERERRLGMVTRERNLEAEEVVAEQAAVVEKMRGLRIVTRGGMRHPAMEARAKVAERASRPVMPGYQFRESNWSIGRAAERAGVKVKLFEPGNRFLAWRKRERRRTRARERAKLFPGKNKKGKGGKAKAKKVVG